MSKAPAPNPSGFEPITDIKEAEIQIRQAASEFAAATLWSENQQHLINTHISRYDSTERTIFVHTPNDMKPAQFMDDLAQKNVSELYFSISCSRSNVFFKAKFLGCDSHGIQFQFPAKVFKVQRRKDFRFPVPDGRVIKITYPDPLFPENELSKKVVDLSAGGLSFIVDDSEEALYSQDLELHHMKFKVNGRDIEADGVVRHVRALPPGGRYKGVKIGIQFLHVKPGDSHHIAAYVFEESRKYFTKLV